MIDVKQLLLGVCFGATVLTAHAVQTSGTDIKVSATGEVVTANDRARVIFTVEENDKDKVTATSRANQKMTKGLALLKQHDPSATLRTQGYYTYPVYDDNRKAGQANVILGWRSGQTVVMTTTDIAHLPKTVAAAQAVFSLNGVQFDLSPEALKKQEAALIDDAYARLLSRIQIVARAMGRSAQDAVLTTLDMVNDGTGMAPRADMLRATALGSAPKSSEIEVPSFEPGESVSTMQVTGYVRLK